MLSNTPAHRDAKPSWKLPPDPLCSWCREQVSCGTYAYGGKVGMKIRLCEPCKDTVEAVDSGVVVQEINDEFSTAFNQMRSV